MKLLSKKIRILLMLLMFTLGIGGAMSAAVATTVQVEAAVRNGFVKVGTNTYYYQNGVLHKGWLKLNGKFYYFNAKGVMVTGWVKTNTGLYRYFASNGVMATGWVVDSKGRRRYFNTSTGIMATGNTVIGGKTYFFDKANGVALIGWYRASNGTVRYFDKTGALTVGWMKDAGGRYRYFYSPSGVMATGWVKSSNKTYFFDRVSGILATGTLTIDGKSYTFASNGVLLENGGTTPPTASSSGTKTIKNYLAGALLPVGQALYVWGGGWNDSTRKGVSPAWKTWYDSQNANYDYHSYNDLSTTNRAKGLDCSGFVGWSAYQVMQTKSGVGYGYTVVSGDVGPTYKSNGWGAICSQSFLANNNYKFYAGDVGYNDGHTWIVLGQCKDTSLVIVHSTPQAGCQISGTPTKDGDYSSQAIELAKKYMSRYYGYTKYDYHTSSGHYIKNGSYFRWSRNVLSDPDGYTYMTADEILRDLFGF